ncbi:MAG TPA: glycine cleavage T C-terminal barrel domain-containing protein [Abditibacteriaceae bacterium]|jgi:folate-binding protein YgfZ
MNNDLYNAAHQSAVWRDMSHFGRFRVAGADGGQLLHHLTTNDIKGLRPDTGCDAALVSSKARLLDLLTVFRQSDGYLVIASPNRRAMFKPHAQQFILFRQDVRVEDITEATALFGVFGPQAQRVLETVGIAPDDSLNGVQMFDAAGASVFIARTRRLPLPGFLLWSEHKEKLAQLVQKSGAPLCDNETYNLLRIEAGIPVAGLELNEEINPWEANLNEEVSLHKGCYNGQEVVARLNTYKKVKQRLRGLKLEKPLPLPMGERVSLLAGERAAGFITSSTVSPRFGAIALAYVRGDYSAAGQQLQLTWNNEAQMATVVDLPFAH